jgi:hypothetical protein
VSLEFADNILITSGGRARQGEDQICLLRSSVTDLLSGRKISYEVKNPEFSRFFGGEGGIKG